jgi:zeaxanthin glucosyltransferase
MDLFMLKLAMLCPELPGHLNPMLSLGYELKKRGHEITFVGVVDARHACEAARIEFVGLCEDDFPLGYWEKISAELGLLSGRAAVRFTVNQYRRTAELGMAAIPPILRELKPDGVLIDQTYSAVAAAADHLGLSYVSVCGALPMNSESGVPPIVMDWPYRESYWATARNRIGNALFQRVTKPVRNLINEQRIQWGLKTHPTLDDTFSKLAQIGQIPREFDYPRKTLPNTFHYTGPLHLPDSREPVPFPFERLDGRPLIYASMGTLQNQLSFVFEIIAEACEPLGAQLVISLGRKGGSLEKPLAGSPIVVDYAPQLELIKKAAMVITHAGMNTAIETLAQGVPMVAIPVTNDQPGVAARVKWTGIGEMIPLAKIEVERLRTAVQSVLSDNAYREAALKMQTAIQQAGGVTLAADIVEKAISTGQPVLTNG